MAKEQPSKDKRPCHYCRKVTYDTDPIVWRTSCGLKLDKKARAEVVLTTEWKYVTCKECKKKEPSE